MAEENIPNFLGMSDTVRTRKYNNLYNSLASQTVGDRSFADMYRALQEAEVGAYKEKTGWPYIFTGASRKSSAFGPLQITYSTALDYFYPGNTETEQRENMNVGNFKEGYTQLPDDVKSYIKGFIEQGINKRNNKGGVYGSFGVGDISVEDHKKHYPFLAAVHVNEKKKISDTNTVASFVNAHFGDIQEDDPQKENKQEQLNNLQTKVNKSLGLIVSPATGEEEGMSPPQPIPVPETDNVFLEQEGPLPDVGEDAGRPDLQPLDVAPETPDAIPPSIVDIPEDKSVFERAYDYLFRKDETEKDELPRGEKIRREILESLEMNEGGIATAIQESRDIETGADTRTKQEMLSDQMAGLGVVGKTAVESVPGVGEAIVAQEISKDISAGDYLSAGLGTAALGVGVLPAGDILNKPLRAAAKKFSKRDIEDAAPSWFKETKVSKDIKPEDAKKTQITTTTATYEKAKDILPEGRTLDFGAGKGVGAKKVGSDTYEPFPDKSFSPTYTDAKTIPSNSYDNITSLNVLNVVKPEVRSEIVQDIGRILKPGGTGIITTRGMDVFGNSKNPVRGILADEPRAVITSSGTYQKGFTQKELREYITEELGESFTVSDVSGLGKAGVKIKKTSDNLNMAEGGTVMDRQMEMFEDGGLMDEGGTIDPESGNEVPPGSTQEEVRDDIPAQLSEGEFVFPADVVRFIGLEKLMQMRQEAKAGLARMEAMGQMGNSEEAVLPDDIPFDLDDIDMEDEPMELQQGGLVPNPYGVYQQPSQFATYGQQIYQAPQIPTIPTPPQVPLQTGFQPVTTPVQTASVPTFEQIMPTTTGQYDELREYINEETGQTMTIPFINGEPIYPIPQGFVPKPTEEVAPTVPETSTVATTRVMDDPGKEDLDAARQKAEEDKYGTGGAISKLGLKDFFGQGQDYIYGVNYLDGVSLPQVLSGNIPDDATILLKNDNDEVRVTGAEYKIIAAEVKAPGTDYTKTREVIAGARERRAKEAREAIKFGEIRDAEGDIRMVSGEEERRDTEERASKFTESLKENNLVVGNRGQIEVKAGATEAEKAQAKKAFNDYVASMATDDDEDDGPSGGGQSFSGGQSFGGFDDVNPDDPEAEGDFNAGGLASKKKPKAKKMKRGGLASKK